ncbi:TetR/AcrR family transcriptional regulator [Actinacidiphila paucisporea]|uniref:Transcriptional regulator, TetR family n=1 Tax=Actinacidiphila paucisporea TaxID=310782 RepID=A0A1M7NNW5_9ACTN|nr:TetR/AcrR family transcriptional regulator [Actinacidiphila paucisporea]SHN05678.1 transcriptional regulator, TetR family [Actinacidiphila paucisporea]
MRTGRPRSFDRDEALERAVTVFWQHGYDATSVSLLTGALGIGAPSLYAAFGDKKKLFFEALDRYNRTYGSFTVRALAEEPDARAAVERLLHDASVAYTRPDRPPGCLLITAATNCSPQSADVAARLREIRVQARTALQQKIAGAVRASSVPAGTDSRALAAFYAAVLQGMSAQARDGAARADLRHIADAALLAWPATA